MSSKTPNRRVPSLDHDNDTADLSRRAALKAVGKYAAFLAGSSSTVLLSAEEVLAQPKPCSFFQNKPGNGPPPNGGPRRCRPNN